MLLSGSLCAEAAIVGPRLAISCSVLVAFQMYAPSSEALECKAFYFCAFKGFRLRLWAPVSCVIALAMLSPAHTNSAELKLLYLLYSEA